jgi:NhaP-type Na+/H+ or K+/H+ antiporter
MHYCKTAILADDVYTFFGVDVFYLREDTVMFLSLFIIFTLGILGGVLFEKIKLPKLVWYIVLGILIGPSVLNVVDGTLIDISSYLRQIALIIILTRSGLSLDINNLKKIGRPAILMSFVPACFEIIGVVILGPLFLDINYLETLLLGSVLAAVSPAIIVPRMIKLIDEEYGKERNVAELVLAGASCDDIFVIILFYSFKGLLSNNTINAWNISQIPLSIILGVLLGILIGFLVCLIIKKLKTNNIIIVIIMLGLSFGMVALEEVLKPYISISALLGIIIMGLIVGLKNNDIKDDIKKTYNSLWNGFEILLFVLVGVATNINYAVSSDGLIILGLITISLVFRSLGVIVCLIATKFEFKEKLFIILSYLPKATVQASIGAIALSEGLACGEILLTAAVISIIFTAPLGAILIDNTYKKLLKKKETCLFKGNTI